MGWNFIIIFFVPPHSSFYTGVRLCQQLFTDPEEASTRRDGPPSPWRISFAVPPNTPPLAKNSPKHRAKWCTKRSFPLIIVEFRGVQLFYSQSMWPSQDGKREWEEGKEGRIFHFRFLPPLGPPLRPRNKNGMEDQTRRRASPHPPTHFFGVRGGNVAKKM